MGAPPSCRLPRRRLPRLDGRISSALLLATIVAGLVATNPGPSAFEEFAADRLSELIREEFCRQGGLPLMLRLVIQDCPGLVRGQRPLLGRFALQNSRRYNFGVLSLYRTQFGGQLILARWSLPRYDALTLGLAGQLLLLRASEAPSEEHTGQRSWLPGNGW